MMSRGFTLVLTLLLLVVPADLLGQTWEAVTDRVENQELVLRPTIEGRRKIYLDDGSLTGESYVLFRGDRLFPLRASEPVRVTDVDAEDDHVEIELASTRLGRGRVDFYGAAPSPDLFAQWLDEVFEVRTPEAEFARYVGNRETHVLHIRGANHLPHSEARELYQNTNDATRDGYRFCGVCFMPTPSVADYQTEQALAMMALQQVRSSYYPSVDPAAQERVSEIGTDVLMDWPLPLKGYRYRFQVVDSDAVNAFAVPTGHIFVTSGLLSALETDDELAAVLAHEIAHVESRHTYRRWRNAQRTSAVLGILGALSGATNNVVDDIVTQMSALAASIFLNGFGRDREQEADLHASLFLQTAGKSEEPLRQSFQKLKFARDAIDPFGSGGGGLFASHPDIDERLARAGMTQTGTFPDEAVFHGLNDDGELVAVLRLDAQRLFEDEFDVVATLSTTAELGERDNVNDLRLELTSGRIELDEVTAESIFPSEEVSAVFRAERRSLVDEPVMGISLNLRNVDRWVPASDAMVP